MFERTFFKATGAGIFSSFVFLKALKVEEWKVLEGRCGLL
jgi:hypothetical protein